MIQINENTTKQEVFDFVVRSLHAQGKKSWNRELQKCLYRGPNGVKCAAGFLISDDVYTTSMEYMNAETIIDSWPCLAPLKPFADLIGQLQFAHDNASTDPVGSSFSRIDAREGIASLLKSVADEFELDPAVVFECWPR